MLAGFGREKMLTLPKARKKYFFRAFLHVFCRCVPAGLIQAELPCMKVAAT
jgi:hypothetical protein